MDVGLGQQQQGLSFVFINLCLEKHTGEALSTEYLKVLTSVNANFCISRLVGREQLVQLSDARLSYTLYLPPSNMLPGCQ